MPPPCLRVSVALINHAFEKPLPDLAFDDQAVDGAVGHGDIPLVAIPSAFAAGGRFGAMVAPQLT